MEDVLQWHGFHGFFPPMEALWLDKMSYKSAELFQLETQKKVVKNGHSGHILGLEHTPAVITKGRRSHGSKKDLVWSNEQLTKNSIEVVDIDRGGEATLHAPGQLVIYPICPLKRWGFSVREYVKVLETATIQLLGEWDVEAEAGKSEPGIYTKKGKIGFLGLRIFEGVSLHGLSLNVANDLSLFEAIVSCGVSQPQLDRVHNYRDDATLNVMFNQWVEKFLNLTKGVRTD